MQTLILDSSQIAANFSCPTEWANRGLVAIDKAHPENTFRPSDSAAAGTLGHKYLEIYYSALACGKSSDEAGLIASRFNGLGDDFPLPGPLRDKTKQRVLDYFFFYGQSGDYTPAAKKIKSIIPSPDNQSLIDSFQLDPLIEKGFSLQLFESNEYLFVLEGRIDFIGQTHDGTRLWMDHKFQFRAHDLYIKSIQFRNYALATGLNLGVINYIRLHDKLDDKKTFVRQPMSFSSLEMRHWREELIEIYVKIARQVRDNHFPQNRNSCSGGFGKPCQFTPLCEEYNLETREAIKRQNFVPKKEWRPW